MITAQRSAPAIIAAFSVATALILGVSAAAAGDMSPANLGALNLEELGNIIITARRRLENLQDVPIAVSVLSREQMERQRVRDLVDLSGMVPNLVITPLPFNGEGALIWLRGFGTLNPEKTNDPPVNVYIDGVYLGTNTGQLLQVFDFERIEVLRGVQGSLFGKNATGGAINITRTKAKGDRVNGTAALTVGSFGRNDYRAVINAPLVADKAWIKVGGLARNDDGYMKNTANPDYRGAKDYRSFIVEAVLKPNDGLDIDLTYDRIDDDSQPIPFVQGFVPTRLDLPVSTPTGPLGIGPYTPCVRFNICAMPTDVNVADSNGPARQQYDLDAVTGNITGHFDGVDLLSITGWRDSFDRALIDVDATRQTFFNTHRMADYNQFTQELRAVSTEEGPFDYVAGAYFFRSNFDSAQDAAQDAAYFGGTAAPGNVVYVGFRPSQLARSWALYAQGNYRFTDAFTLTLGGRYTHDYKRFQLQLFNYADNFFGGETLRSAVFPGTYKSHAFTPHVAISSKMRPGIMAYASYTRGYNGGGFNPGGTNAFNIGPYGDEHINDFEAGFKSDLLDQTLRLNVNAFHIIYRGKQLSVVTTDPIVGASSQIRNVGNEEINGASAEITAVPVRGLNLTGSISYMDADYTRFDVQIQAGQPVTDNTALTPVRSPKITASVEAAYIHQVGDGELSVSALYRFQSTYQMDAINSPQGLVKPGSIIDAFVAYDFNGAGAAWQVSASVKNLTDRIHPIQLTQAGTFIDEKVLREGRTYALTVGTKF